MFEYFTDTLFHVCYGDVVYSDHVFLCYRNPNCTRLASGSKDNDIRIWDVAHRSCVRSLTGHTGAVKSIKWGGTGIIYSASQDRTIKVWEAATGKLIRTLEGHALGKSYSIEYRLCYTIRRI